MCLLMQINKETPAFSDEFLRGVFQKNADGLGIMWVEDGKLHMYKALPQTLDEAIKIFRDNTQGRDCCCHWRMKTHGDIDLTNCHPYPVFGFDGEESEHPMLLMHNGVLSTGNQKDTTKSDTWHYVRDFVRPMLDGRPELLHSEAFLKLVESHIGSGNKFAMLGTDGKPVVFNRKAGVEYNGAWLSNTYAWDYYGLHPDAKKSYSYGGYGRFDRLDWWDTDTTVKGKSKKPATNVASFKPASKTLNAKVRAQMEDIGTIAPDTLPKIHYADMVHLYNAQGWLAADDFIDYFMTGDIDEAEFLDGLKFTSKATATIQRVRGAFRQFPLNIEV